ncbi:hypothetical protein OG762_34220 [Streptomyces sp. NBC_01136]|nr:hypothetical protein OG762_34220 [Streptomyces sp. NBC_01136]
MSGNDTQAQTGEPTGYEESIEVDDTDLDEVDAGDGGQTTYPPYL